MAANLRLNVLPTCAWQQGFSVKMEAGVLATSYKAGDKFYIDPYKLLPMERFLPKPPGSQPARGVSKGGRLVQCFRDSCSTLLAAKYAL